MTTYLIRQDGATVYGPYEADEIRGWLAEGRIGSASECSPDGREWRPVAEVLGAAATTPAPAREGGGAGFPEPSLYIRQGANIQGPFRMGRLRGYVVQRRIQPYMLFSQDGVWWVGAEHVPGLLPAGYTAVPPQRGPSVVPDAPTAGAPTTAAPAVPAPATEAVPPSAAAPAAPAKEVGSSTLVGYRLDEAETLAPSGAAAPDAAPAAAPAARTFYVRHEGNQVYGPYEEGSLAGWIAEGRIRPDTDLSLDGRTWMPGARMPGLSFPAAARVPPPRAAAEAEAPRGAERPSWRTKRRM
jgi:hypothetical protein